ncbi:hypothetical protein GCM10012279_46000 [Micromonospora yangpuensis]|nr:hypothetical protein GCM10012279_46000 [Micromonospora yangpuensis]
MVRIPLRICGVPFGGGVAGCGLLCPATYFASHVTHKTAEVMNLLAAVTIQQRHRRAPETTQLTGSLPASRRPAQAPDRAGRSVGAMPWGAGGLGCGQLSGV